MKTTKTFAVSLALLLIICLVIGLPACCKPCNHQWQDATCTDTAIRGGISYSYNVVTGEYSTQTPYTKKIKPLKASTKSAADDQIICGSLF